MPCCVMAQHSRACKHHKSIHGCSSSPPFIGMHNTLTDSHTDSLTDCLQGVERWGGGGGGKGVSPPHQGPFTFTMMMMVELLLLLQLWLLWLWMAIPMFIFLHTHTCMLACLQGGKGSVGNWYTVVSYGCTKLPTFRWEGRGVL